jgi:hypothetical protein
MSTGGLEAEARVERASILSPSAAQAISAITQRTGANSTAVIIGAYAGAIAASLNVSDVAVRSLVATRQRKVARRAVAALNLNGLFRVALPSDLTVDEYFLSAQISAHKAVVYSETNPAELESELDSIMDGRGVQIKQYIYFNDMSKSQIRRHGHIGGGGAEEGDLTGGPRGNGTQIRPIENHTPDKDSKLLLDVFSAYPKLDMNLYIDRRSVPVRSASFLRVLEQFIIESSLHPLSRLGSMVQLASSELDAT